MADYNHIENIIMGEVIRVQERRPATEQKKELDQLIYFLGKMVGKIATARMNLPNPT